MMVSSQIRRAILQIYVPSLIMSLGIGMIVPAIPFLGKTFGVSVGFAAQVVTVQLIGRAFSMIPSGVLLDRIGIRLGMIIGASVAVVTAVTTAFAPFFWVILLSQLFWGMGSALWRFGLELAAIDLVAVDQRGRQLSALFGIYATGTALGPAIGGIILDTWGFRPLFMIFAGMASVVLAISATVREMQKRHSVKKDVYFTFTRLSHLDPYFRATYVVLIIASFSAMLRAQVLNSMLPIYMVSDLGYTATSAEFQFFVVGIITFVMIVPAVFISDKIGRKWATAPPALLSGIAFVAYPVVHGLWGFTALSVMLGIANGMALGSMTTYTYDIVPHATRAQFQAMRRTIGEVGSFTGPLIGGIIANAFGTGISFLFFSPLHLVSAFLLIVVAKESLLRQEKKGGDRKMKSLPDKYSSMSLFLRRHHILQY